MTHELRKLWAQIRWISRKGGEPIDCSNDPELKRLAMKNGQKVRP